MLIESFRSTSIKVVLKKKREFKKCSFSECSVRDPVAIVCKQCKFNYCLEHRLEADHYCKVQQKVSSRQIPQERRDDQRLAPLGRDKIAREQRFYFRVYFPGRLDRKPRSMFFSKAISVGKMIDEVFELGKIPAPSEAGSPRPGVFCARRSGSVNLLPYMSKLSELEEQKILAQNDSIVLANPSTNPLSLSLYAPAAAPVQHTKKDRKAATSGQHKQKRPCVIM
uniref:AN1-type domain-containing protein n=1 Tax=Rhodosorus marinus TaxID=101924 RepID=A0A7S0G3I6_9RHOD|mmetsp:Transcript_284/g.298  ORF Transcript_284/g.298 Transcript_284/m.298 type:complete len:224 (+) Transcript_284:371-1042(+)